MHQSKDYEGSKTEKKINRCFREDTKNVNEHKLKCTDRRYSGRNIRKSQDPIIN